MTTPTPDTCALCGNTRAEHKNMERDKRRGFHPFAERCLDEIKRDAERQRARLDCFGGDDE